MFYRIVGRWSNRLGLQPEEPGAVSLAVMGMAEPRDVVAFLGVLMVDFGVRRPTDRTRQFHETAACYRS
jgi:hypothetical protein